MPNWVWTKTTIKKGHSGITIQKIKDKYLNNSNEVDVYKTFGFNKNKMPNFDKTNFKFDKNKKYKILEILEKEPEFAFDIKKNCIFWIAKSDINKDKKIKWLKKIFKNTAFENLNSYIKSEDEFNELWEIVKSKTSVNWISIFDWYKFNIRNLGTKWSFELENICDYKDRITFQTETAWSWPEAFYKKIKNDFNVSISYIGEEESDYTHSKECEKANLNKEYFECINEWNDGKDCHYTEYKMLVE